MCGRLSLHDRNAVHDLAGMLHMSPDQIDLSGIHARYNLAPTYLLPVIWNQGGNLVVSPMQWGWQPQRAIKQGRNSSHINARSETVYQLPTFKAAARKQRCIIIANGYFEWHRDYQDRPLEPHYIHPRQQNWLAIAAIYHKGAVGEEACLLTMSPNKYLAPIHHRMPCMLTIDGIQAWLAADTPEKGAAALQPVAEDFAEEYFVSEKVNSVRNEGSDLISRTPPPQQQMDWLNL